MAEGSQVMSFGSEVERANAIDSFDVNSGSREELNAMIKAPIVEKAAETPAGQQESQAQETPPVESVVVDPAPQSVEPEELQDVFTLKKGDLPEGYKTPGHVFKSFAEKDAYIERQAKYIKDLQAKSTEETMALRREFEQFKSQKPEPTTFQPADRKPVDNSLRLSELQNKIGGLDPYEEEYQKVTQEILGLTIQETRRLNDELKNSYKRIDETNQKYESFAETNQRKIREEQINAARANDFKEIAQLASKYKDEFGLTDDPIKVEEKFNNWGEEVCFQYFGKYPEKDGLGRITKNGIAAVNEALGQLDLRSPSLIEKCEMVKIPTEPDKDIINYLKACELLEYRDGVRGRNPDGSIMYAEKFDPHTGKKIRDSFPTLEAALAVQRAQSGYYKQKELSAYDKGTRDILKASQRRDTNELLNNESGHAEAQTMNDLAALMENATTREEVEKIQQAIMAKIAQQ